MSPSCIASSEAATQLQAGQLVSVVAALFNENHCFLPIVAPIRLMHKPGVVCSDFGKQETGTKLMEGMYIFF